MPEITARFHPQAWINDYAVEVDPEGPTTWDVTAEVIAMTETERNALKDDQYETDDLRFSVNAPKWIQEWSGPFYVEVVESIQQYKSEDA
jgi:hypothetical protein